ncbi:MAG: hypothetical protein GXP62_08730, partial [Oligoflexia bacterium]|nr:hypothetical protein [Oligoflexia bacterium]
MLGLLLGALGTASAARAAGQVDRVDRAIAVVGDRVITATEVDIAVTLASHDVSPEPVLDPGAEDPDEWWIEQVELRELAGDVSVYRPQAGEVRDRLGRLLAAFDPAELANTQ